MIGVTAVFGVLYYYGIKKARYYHLLFIHTSKTVGIFSFTLGIVSRSNSDIFLIIIALVITEFFYFIESNENQLKKILFYPLELLPIFSMIYMMYFATMIVESEKIKFNLIKGIAFVIASRLKIEVWILDETDIFHILFSIGIYYFSYSI